MIAKTVDEYFASIPEDKRRILQKIREVIKMAVPGAEEAMAYGVAAFKFEGKHLVYYAAFKNHIGFYPTPSAITAFKDELKGYRQGKGTIQFQLDEPIPYDLIGRIAKFRTK